MLPTNRITSNSWRPPRSNLALGLERQISHLTLPEWMSWHYIHGYSLFSLPCLFVFFVKLLNLNWYKLNVSMVPLHRTDTELYESWIDRQGRARLQHHWSQSWSLWRQGGSFSFQFVPLELKKKSDNFTGSFKGLKPYSRTITSPGSADNSFIFYQEISRAIDFPFSQSKAAIYTCNEISFHTKQFGACCCKE